MENNNIVPRKSWAEFVAANLIESDSVSLRDMVLQPMGEASGAIFSDVLEVAGSENATCTIRVARTKPEEDFPDTFFTVPADPIVARVEQEARDTFFQLLTNELDRLRIYSILRRRDDVLWSDESLGEVWGVPGQLNPRQRSIMTDWAPQLPLVMNDPIHLAACLTAIVGLPVCVDVKSEAPVSLEALPTTRRVGKCTVGCDAFPGLSATTHWQQYLVSAGPILPEYLPQWQTGGTRRQALESLYDWFFPGNAVVETRVLVKDDPDWQPLLGSGQCLTGYVRIRQGARRDHEKIQPSTVLGEAECRLSEAEVSEPSNGAQRHPAPEESGPSSHPTIKTI